MAQLAIQGHATRGNEVIELLKMLGGVNKHNYTADCESLYFYISNETNNIYYDWANCPKTNVLLFTLEDFLKRYPYRVGDKVLWKYDTKIPYTIKEMCWVDKCDDVRYFISCKGCTSGWWRADELLPIDDTDNLMDTLKETQQVVREGNENLGKAIEKLKRKNMLDVSGTISKVEEKISAINFHYRQFDDKVQLLLGKDFEIIQEDGKTFVVRKQPQYPKTYAECCKVVNASPYVALVYDIHDGQAYSYDVDNLEHYQNVRKLLICRDAYLKLANNWQPNWKDISTQKYSISVDKDEIIKSHRVTGSRVLVFPTAEMRDIFYENFKDLINECKELL